MAGPLKRLLTGWALLTNARLELNPAIPKVSGASLSKTACAL